MTIVLGRWELGTHKGHQTMYPESQKMGQEWFWFPPAVRVQLQGGQRTRQGHWEFFLISLHVLHPILYWRKLQKPRASPTSPRHPKPRQLVPSLPLCSSGTCYLLWCLLLLPNLHKGTSFHLLSGKPWGITAVERKRALKLIRILLPSCVALQNYISSLNLPFICKMNTMQYLMIKPILVTNHTLIIGIALMYYMLAMCST